MLSIAVLMAIHFVTCIVDDVPECTYLHAIHP